MFTFLHSFNIFATHWGQKEVSTRSKFKSLVFNIIVWHLIFLGLILHVIDVADWIFHVWRLRMKHGSDWASIGAVLGRSASSVKDRYRLMKDTCNSGTHCDIM